MPNPTCNNQTQVYWNGTSFFSATAFFSDSALTTPSPDGWYAFGGMIRQILNGVLLSAVPCDSCVIPCGDPFVFGGGGTGKYIINFGMGLTSGAAVITFNTGIVETTWFPVPDQCTWTYGNLTASEYSSLTGGYMKGLIGAADGVTFNSANTKPCFKNQNPTGSLTVNLGSGGIQSVGQEFPYNISNNNFPNSGPIINLGSQVGPIGWTGLTNNAGAFQSTLLSWNCTAQSSTSCSLGTALGVPSSPYNPNLPLAPNLQSFGAPGGTIQWNAPGNETRNSVMVIPSPPNVASNVLTVSVVGPCSNTWWGIDVKCPEPLTKIPCSTQFGDLEFDQSPAGQASKTPLADVCAYPLNRFIYHVPVDAWGNANPNSFYHVPGDTFPASPNFDPITGLPLGQPKGVLGLGDWVFEDENGVTPVAVGVYKTQFDALDGLGLRSWAVQVGPREYKDMGGANSIGGLNALPPEDYVGQVWAPDWAGGITFNDVQETGARVPGIVRSITPCDPIDSFDCDPTTGLCSDPGTGLGQYLTLADCNNNCNPPDSWDCVNNACIDPGTGLGQYSTLSACNAVCPQLLPCGSLVSVGSGGVGQYTIESNAGTTVGAVIVRFDPWSWPDRCTWTYGTLSASEYSSPNVGYMQGAIGTASSGGDITICNPIMTNGNGSNGLTYPGNQFTYQPNGTFSNQGALPGGMGPYADYLNGGVTLITNPLLVPGWCMMVIPKTDPTITNVTCVIDGPCGGSSGTVWDWTIACPVDLSVKDRGDLGGTCQVYTTVFYTASPHTTDGLSPANLQVHDWVFTDKNGEFPLLAGDYPARFPGGPHKIMTVSDDGVITALVACP
jgi:hypothetical protein